MRTKTKKLFSVLMTLAMVFSLLAVFPAQEAEAGSTDYSADPVRRLTAGSYDLGDYVPITTIRVEIDADDIAERHWGETQRLFFDFPRGAAATVQSEVYDDSIGDWQLPPRAEGILTIDADDDVSHRGHPTRDGNYREWYVDVTLPNLGANQPEDMDDILFDLYVTALSTTSGYEGAVEVDISPEPGTPFSADTLTVANIVAEDVNMEVRDVFHITESNVENNIGNLRFTENVADAVDDVTLSLPRGFYWDTEGVGDWDFAGNYDGFVYAQERYGINSGTGDRPDIFIVPVEFSNRADLAGVKYRDVELLFTEASRADITEIGAIWDNISLIGGDPFNSAVMSSWEVLSAVELFDFVGWDRWPGEVWDQAPGLRANVDKATASKGDVDATVSGAGPTPQTVAIYGEALASTETIDTPTLLSGKFQDLGEFEIREDIAGSLPQRRTIELTLPEGVKWKVPQAADGSRLSGGDVPEIIGAATERKGIEFGTTLRDGEGDENWMITDSKRRTIRTTILRESDASARDGALLTFGGGEVAISPDFEGEIEVEVGGTAGIEGTVTLGEVVKPVAATISEQVQLEIGKRSQAIGDVTITEAMAEAASRSDAAEGIIELRVPERYGATFEITPEAEIVDGDMIIERIWRSADRMSVFIQVAASSDEASEILVTDLELTLDRTPPEGEVRLHVKGDAIVDEEIPTRQYFLDSDVLHDLVVGEVVDEVTPTEVMMWIGETTYTVDDVTEEMDVTPFIANDRTFVPVRFVSEAFGAEVDWGPKDALTEWVTIEKGDTLIEIEIGSPVITVTEDGIERTETADVEAQIVDDRTYLPIRAVGEILGASFDWGPKDALTEWVSFSYY